MFQHPVVRALLLIAALAAGVCGCDETPAKPAPRPASRPGAVRRGRVIAAMGIAPKLIVYGPDAATAERFLAAAAAAIHRVDRMMSTYKPDSEVSRLNRANAGAWHAVSTELAFVLKLSRHLSTESGGRFDVTARPLITLWKNAGRENQLPTDAEILAATARVGWQAVELDELRLRVRFAKDDMSVDLGAVAKGFAVDRAAAAMKAAGATAGLVEAGGDLLAFGAKPGGARWRVGIRNPRALEGRPPVEGEPAMLNTLAVADRAVVTSGHYERFTEIGGKRYSHILDPVTGRPVDQKLASVTVIAPTCAMADGLATAVAVMGPIEGMKLIERLEDTEALLYLDDGPDKPLRPVRSTRLAALETD